MRRHNGSPFTHLEAQPALERALCPAMDRVSDEGPEQIAVVDQTLEAMVSAIKADPVGSFVPSGAVLAQGG